MAAVVAFLLLGIAPTEAGRTGDPSAARALDAITTGNFDPKHPTADFPADFQRVMGYLPKVAIGPHGTPILYKPTGGCSAPLGIDATDYNFDLVCKEHDLSYDVLRYAGDYRQAAAGRSPHPGRRHVRSGSARPVQPAPRQRRRLRPLSHLRRVLRGRGAGELLAPGIPTPLDTRTTGSCIAMVMLTIALLGIPWVYRHLHRRATALTRHGEFLLPLVIGPPRLVDLLLPGLAHHQPWPAAVVRASTTSPVG